MVVGLALQPCHQRVLRSARRTRQVGQVSRHRLHGEAALLEGRDEVVEIDRTDGVRLLLATGDTLHFRGSGNAPELRCYAESATPALAEGLLEWGLARAASAIGR